MFCGSLQRIIDVLNRLIALTIPGKQESGTMVIPRVAVRSGGRSVLSGDGHSSSSPYLSHHQERHDAGSSEGGASNARLRSGAWRYPRLREGRHVRGSGVEEPERDNVEALRAAGTYHRV